MESPATPPGLCVIFMKILPARVNGGINSFVFNQTKTAFKVNNSCHNMEKQSWGVFSGQRA